MFKRWMKTQLPQRKLVVNDCLSNRLSWFEYFLRIIHKDEARNDFSLTNSLCYHSFQPNNIPPTFSSKRSQEASKLFPPTFHVNSIEKFKTLREELSKIFSKTLQEISILFISTDISWQQLENFLKFFRRKWKSFAEIRYQSKAKGIKRRKRGWIEWFSGGKVWRTTEKFVFVH